MFYYIIMKIFVLSIREPRTIIGKAVKAKWLRQLFTMQNKDFYFSSLRKIPPCIQTRFPSISKKI